MSRRESRRETRAPVAPSATRRPDEGTRQRPLFSLSLLLDPREPFLVPLLLLVVARAVLWSVMPVATEDAYITFRYARHLASGHGLVYNPGERVFGFTSPVWTLWCAISYLVQVNPVTWARAWSVAADAVTLIAFGALLRRHGSRFMAWCFTFFFASWPYFSAVAVSGMECSMVLALMTLSAFWIETRSVLAGPTLAALAMARPEGLIVAALLGVVARWRDRWIAVGLAALGMIGLFAYYGTVVPQSVVAKAQVYGTPGFWAGRYWWEWIVPTPLGRWPTLGDTVPLGVMALVLAPAFVLGLPELWRMRRTSLALATAGGLAVWLGYAVLGVAYFWWYLEVPLGAVALVAAAGFPRLAKSPALTVSCVIYVVGMWSLHPKTYISRSGIESMTFGRAAEVLRQRAEPGQKVLLEPIGMIGFRAPLVVVDEVGLVSPRVVEMRRRGAGWYTDLEAAERPDWLVLRAGTVRGGEAFAGTGAPFRGPAERESLLARYSVEDSGIPSAGEGALEILRRRR